MPRYFFDVDDGVEMLDEVGREIELTAAIRTDALKVITQLVSAEAEDAKETVLVLKVRDEDGSVPLRIRLICQIEDLRRLHN